MASLRSKLLTASPVIAHPYLKHRKPIVAKALLARSLDADIGLHDPDDSAALSDMRSGGSSAANNRASCDADGRRLDGHLHGVQEALKTALAQHEDLATPVRSVQRTPNGSANDALSRFASDRLRIDCARCGARNGHVCDGSERDHATMRDAPECWSVISDMFEFAMDEAERVYLEQGFGFEGVEPIKVFFRTAAVPSADGVGAYTEFVEDGGPAARAATVALDLPHQNFDADGYFGILYQVFHEVFVHVVQNVTHPGPRRAWGEDCPLGEGLVDAAAFDVLEVALGRRPDLGTRVPDSLAPVALRMLRRARQQREERCRVSSRTMEDRATVAEKARAFGREAFEELVDVRGGTRGREWARNIAFSLNLADLAKGRRRDIVVRTYSGLRSADLNHRIAVRGALDRFAETGHIASLLQAFEVR